MLFHIPPKDIEELFKRTGADASHLETIVRGPDRRFAVTLLNRLGSKGIGQIVDNSSLPQLIPLIYSMKLLGSRMLPILYRALERTAEQNLSGISLDSLQRFLFHINKIDRGFAKRFVKRIDPTALRERMAKCGIKALGHFLWNLFLVSPQKAKICTEILMEIDLVAQLERTNSYDLTRFFWNVYQISDNPEISLLAVDHIKTALASVLNDPICWRNAPSGGFALLGIFHYSGNTLPCDTERMIPDRNEAVLKVIDWLNKGQNRYLMALCLEGLRSVPNRWYLEMVLEGLYATEITEKFRRSDPKSEKSKKLMDDALLQLNKELERIERPDENAG